MATPIAASARRTASIVPTALLLLAKLSVPSSSTTTKKPSGSLLRIFKDASSISATVGAVAKYRG